MTSTPDSSEPEPENESIVTSPAVRAVSQDALSIVDAMHRSGAIAKIMSDSVPKNTIAAAITPGSQLSKIIGEGFTASKIATAALGPGTRMSKIISDSLPINQIATAALGSNMQNLVGQINGMLANQVKVEPMFKPLTPPLQESYTVSSPAALVVRPNPMPEMLEHLRSLAELTQRELDEAAAAKEEARLEREDNARHRRQTNKFAAWALVVGISSLLATVTIALWPVFVH